MYCGSKLLETRDQFLVVHCLRYVKHVVYKVLITLFITTQVVSKPNVGYTRNTS